MSFARFDQFPDPWEGVLPPETVALASDRFQNAPLREGDTLTDFEALVRDVNRVNKLCSYANCWFMNDHESDAMWRLYAPGGVAVQSTFYGLCASVEAEPGPVFVGEVRYLDFRAEQPPTYGNSLAVAYYKRMEFEHERELRAVVVRHPEEWTQGTPPYEEYRDTHPKHAKVPVDLDALIERVLVAPGSSERFREQMRDAIRESGLDRQIEVSTMDDVPRLL